MVPKRTIEGIYPHTLCLCYLPQHCLLLPDSAQITELTVTDLSVSEDSSQTSRVRLAKPTDDKYILNVSGSFRGKRWFKEQCTLAQGHSLDSNLGGISVSLF